jgi:DNA modification methylase
MKPYYEEDGITIYHADCRDVLPTLPTETAVVIADPPYGETACRWDKCCHGWLDFVRSTDLWCFGSFRFFLQNAAAFTDWNFAQELIWEKQNGSGAVVDRFNRVHEIIAQFYRGEWGKLHRDVPRFTSQDKRSHRTHGRGLTPHRGTIGSKPYDDNGTRMVRSVLPINNLKGLAEHPTQKPINLLTLLVQYSVAPNGSVIDPFVGSGTTLVAAKRLGRSAVGIEIEERYCETAARRLSQKVFDFEKAG